jgi:hypothetical protein
LAKGLLLLLLLIVVGAVIATIEARSPLNAAVLLRRIRLASDWVLDRRHMAIPLLPVSAERHDG